MLEFICPEEDIIWEFPLFPRRVSVCSCANVRLLDVLVDAVVSADEECVLRESLSVVVFNKLLCDEGRFKWD